MGTMPTVDAPGILEEQERRRDIMDLIASILTGKSNKGVPILSRVERRVFVMYISRASYRAIEAKTGVSNKVVHRWLIRIHNKIYNTIKVFDYVDLLIPPSSTLEAKTPEIKLATLFDTRQKSFNGSYWGITQNRKAWKTRVRCEVPEYFNDSFGDAKTKCSQCGIKCTRKAA